MLGAERYFFSRAPVEECLDTPRAPPSSQTAAAGHQLTPPPPPTPPPTLQEFRTAISPDEFRMVRAGHWDGAWRSFPSAPVKFRRYKHCVRSPDNTPIVRWRYNRKLNFQDSPFEISLFNYTEAATYQEARVAPRQFEFEVSYEGVEDGEETLPHAMVLTEHFLKTVKQLVVLSTRKASARQLQSAAFEDANPALSPFEELVDWLGANEADLIGEREPPVTCEISPQPTGALGDFKGDGTADGKGDGKVAGVIPEEWWDKWQKEIAEWWMIHPMKDKLAQCYAAMGLHLATRLDWQFMRHQLWAGGALRVPPAPPRQREVEESACDWIQQGTPSASVSPLNLPDFPAFTEDFELPSVIPIPRLLPSYTWVQSLEQHPSPGPAAELGGPAMIGAGFAMGSLLTLAGAGAAYLYRGRTARTHSTRPQLRRKLERGSGSGRTSN